MVGEDDRVKGVVRGLVGILAIEEKGGPGSGHRGHRGIPGKRGGSLPGVGGGFLSLPHVAKGMLGDFEVSLSGQSYQGEKDSIDYIAESFLRQHPGSNEGVVKRSAIEMAKRLHRAPEEHWEAGRGSHYIHNHPIGDSVFSVEDLAAIRERGYRTSAIIGGKDKSILIARFPKDIEFPHHSGGWSSYREHDEFLKRAGINIRRESFKDAKSLQILLEDIISTTKELSLRLKGGPGSGHRGHSGRPGKRGGSVSGVGRSTLSPRDYVGALPESQREAVVNYTASGYKEVNKHLRKGTEATDETLGIVAELDQVMLSAPPITNATLYRALGSSPEELGMVVGDIYQDDAFVSTTKSSAYMYKELSRLPTRATIKLPKRTRSSVQGIAAHYLSKKKVEQEILLARGTRFLVKSISKQGKYNHVTLEVLTDVQ